MSTHRVVSRDEWIKAPQALLTEEKALTRQRDRLSEARRRLTAPSVRVMVRVPSIARQPEVDR